MDERPAGQMAEAELKIRLTEAEFTAMPGVLTALSFTPTGEGTLRDDYLDFVPAPTGGWDYTRLRTKNGVKGVVTEKRWVTNAQGQPVRLETERPAGLEEMAALLAAAGTVRTLFKRRWTFAGIVAKRQAEVVLDALERNGGVEYFLECEILVTPDEFVHARGLIALWMRKHLPVQDLSLAPSMLEMLLSS